MKGRGVRRIMIALVLCSGLGIFNSLSSAQAEEPWQWTSGGTQPGQWMLGFRAGFSPLTQSLQTNVGTDVGSLVNVQGMYSLNDWLSLGLMLEWERRAVDQQQPAIDLGHQDTVSVLPTIELRPVRYGPITPYVSMGFGVNVNSFGENTGTRISPSNNFAWRLAWGGDYFLTSMLALNAEMAYKRNDGHVTINGVRSDDWNASSFGFLVGARMFF